VNYFVFVEEHPDSVNDGYFLNRGDEREWVDLPASFHNDSASFAFADGHAEIHKWVESSTLQPSRPDGAPLPLYIRYSDLSDWRWVMERMSVGSGSSRYSY